VLTVLSCGAPPSDWKGVRADLPQVANTLVPRPDQLSWSAVIDSLAWERILLHQWRGDEAEVRQFFQELLSYAQVTDQAVATLLAARAKAIDVGRQWGLRRPGREDLQNLVEVYGGRIVDVATHLGVDRRQVYRWLEYDRRGESSDGPGEDSGVDEP
jgi:transcriptional regulator of acetoin/glycerol metabolism